MTSYRKAEEDVIYLASGGYDHTIRFWIPHEGKCSRVIQHLNSQINDLKITPNQALLAVASFQHIHIYNIQAVQNNTPEINLEGFSKNATSIGFMDNHKRLFSGGEDQVTRIWDLKVKKTQSSIMHRSNSAVNSVKLHPNQNEFYIGQQSGQIEVWDIRTNSGPSTQLPLHDTSVQCLSLNPVHDMLAAIDNTGYCRIYSPANQLIPIHSWKAHTRYGLKCLFSPNGNYLVTTSADYTAKIWEVNKLLDEAAKAKSKNIENCIPKIRYNLQVDNSLPAEPYKLLTCEHQRWVWDVAFSADSQFLFTGSSDNVVRLWHVETAVMRREYTGHQRAVTAIAFSDC